MVEMWLYSSRLYGEATNALKPLYGCINYSLPHVQHLHMSEHTTTRGSIPLQGNRTPLMTNCVIAGGLRQE